MKKILFFFMFYLACFIKSHADTNVPDFFPKIPPYEIIKELIPVLERASVVIIQKESGKPPFITGIVLINAKTDEVIKVVRTYEKYHEFVPNVSKVKVLERYPESNTQISEYNIGFDIALGIKFTVTYTLEQNFLENEKIIFGLPAKKGTQVFGDVRYIEKYYDTEDGKTVMVYSAYADLSSFGLLSKLVYKAFPELQIPSLVAVSTLFPEAVKERIENKKIITEPKKINYNEIKLPDRISLKNILPLLRMYGTVIISWYPDNNDVRFFSSFILLPKRNTEYVKSSITDFRSWPRVFRMIEKAEPQVMENGYKVNFRIKYKIALPIELDYTTLYKWDSNGERLSCEIDNSSKKDIEGMLCAWDFYGTKYGTVIGYTEFSDLRTGSYFLKILMDKIQGFGIGLRVALVSAFAELIKRNI